MPKLIKVLSIDGGGIRGIIPAMILAEIERRTGQPIARMFDLIAGTSTGGILTLALTRPGPRRVHPKFTAAELVDLYEKEGPRIFSRSIWHRLHAVGNLLEEKYPSKGLQTALRAYLGQTRLKDALTEVLVTAYEIEGRFPWFFKRHRARTDTATHDFPMTDVAHATAAAPTYFEPVKVTTREGSDEYALIDGGVYANNPAMCAYVEAQTRHPRERDFLVVSLGTGELTRPLPYEQVKGWGLAHWAQPILNVVFDGVSDTTDYQLRQLLPSNRYYRFQTRLDEGNEDMDNASRANLAALKRLGEGLIRSESARLTELCGHLG
ncbi:MAG: patatin-like phospholipase family protein [Verrucomicrobia bacterium]|jgi:patatin-like phospholipase/acyl hydrolase|nr:patatin-like phospholipase family protein [Verrucomicrobiota bacterium]